MESLRSSPNILTKTNLRLPYLGKEAKLFENQGLETVDNTFGAVNLRITHSTRKPLNEVVKDLTPDPENAT